MSITIANPIEVHKTGNGITGFRVSSFLDTKLGQFICFRLLENRDAKVLVTSKGNQTGTGKTTLALSLAHDIAKLVNYIFERQLHWTAQEYSFIDTWEYLDMYGNANPGDILITDELEFMADKRRHQTHENVRISQAWSILRYKNVITLGTAPGLWQLDKRIPENTDIWINVISKGKANVYFLTIDDFTGELIRRRLRKYGFKEMITWPDLGETKDYRVLHSKKQDIGVPGLGEKQEELSETDIEQAEKDVKHTVACNLLEKKANDEIYLTQHEIGEIVGYSQQTIARIKRNEVSV